MATLQAIVMRAFVHLIGTLICTVHVGTILVKLLKFRAECLHFFGLASMRSLLACAVLQG